MRNGHKWHKATKRDRRPMPIDAIDDAADFSKLRAPSA
jgi:hypothetical protein